MARTVPRGDTPNVAIVQAWMPHYRKPFFDQTRARLRDAGVELQLFHGQPFDEDARKRGAVDVPWAVKAPNRVFHLGSYTLTWQACYRALRHMELVICEQSSSQLLLYPLWGRYLVRGQPLGLWGHGRNFQEGRASYAGEAVKHVVSRRVHWWFAYNQRSAEVVRALGYPSARITDVQNAIDTAELQEAAKQVTQAELDRLRADLDLPGEHVGLYVGAMYREKRLPYLLEACREIRRLVPDFNMVFIGAGPDEALVAEAAARHPWIRHLGTVVGPARVPYFLLADLHLMPGLVGLTLLDSFALGTPLVTVADSEHSPEIAYLTNEENGLMLAGGTPPRAYAHAVADLLTDPERRSRLAAGCAAARKSFTVEAMSGRFAAGVLAALDAPVPARRLRRVRETPDRRPASGGVPTTTAGTPRRYGSPSP